MISKLKQWSKINLLINILCFCFLLFCSSCGNGKNDKSSKDYTTTEDKKDASNILYCKRSVFNSEKSSIRIKSSLDRFELNKIFGSKGNFAERDRQAHLDIVFKNLIDEKEEIFLTYFMAQSKMPCNEDYIEYVNLREYIPKLYLIRHNDFLHIYHDSKELNLLKKIPIFNNIEKNLFNLNKTETTKYSFSSNLYGKTVNKIEFELKVTYYPPKTEN
jgi:hypothetical protein